MPRIARVVVPGLPHHVIQRGNRRQRTFFSGDDYRAYLALLRWWAPRTGVKIWTYCLMPNHVHLVAVPDAKEGLADCMSEVHQRYSRRINEERGWTGYLWQGRFLSTVMDPSHAVAAARYIAMNPVRAGLVSRPDEWSHSSLGVHLGIGDDAIIARDAYAGLVDDWSGLLALDVSDDEAELLRRHARTGRPLGSRSFVTDIEQRTGRMHLMRPKGRPSRRLLRQAVGAEMVSVPI